MPLPRDPDVLRSAYETVLKIADDFTRGRVGMLGLSRAMCRVQYYVDAQDDPNFKLFTEIADRSWHLPIGSDREFSTCKGTDEELMREIEKLENKYTTWCRNIVPLSNNSMERTQASRSDRHEFLKPAARRLRPLILSLEHAVR
jgi:hypothetical protein